ncbi:hypothetical protein NMG60_11013156 [Bertholletia excelsa]
MVYTSYTPTYYTSLHDSITSLCKTILHPFAFRRQRRLPAIVAAEQRLSKLQSDNLKWQQDSFHQILKLIGLCKEGIVPEPEVAAFRAHLLETLIASPADHEQPVILRDKLVFLQELLYAKCITEDEYHLSKRPLLQRLAVQGVEIESRDVIVAAPKQNPKPQSSAINLTAKETSNSNTDPKQGEAMKQIEGPSQPIGFLSSQKSGKAKEEKALNELYSSRENPFWQIHLKEKESETRSILMPESFPPETTKVEKNESEKVRKNPFRALFQRGEGGGGGGSDHGPDSEKKVVNSAKKQWGFDGFKKWKKSDTEDETAPLPLNERSDSEAFFLDSSSPVVTCPAEEKQGTNQIKRKLPSSDSTSERRKQLNMTTTANENQKSPENWATFDDDENCHPNLFAPSYNNPITTKQARQEGDHMKNCYKNNPFVADYDQSNDGNKQNPFWSPRHGSSMLC